MFRAQSRLLRLIAAGTALITTWCLGCCAYEPLVDGLLGAPKGPIVACAGDDGNPMPTSASTAPAGAVAAAHGAMSPVCACGTLGCVAPAPSLATTAVGAMPAPDAVVTESSAPSSVDRTPLVPPPQAHPLRV